MKKLIGIFAIAALASSAFAQGTVTLGNQTGTVKQWTAADNTTLISVPKGGGYVELIAAPSGTALANPFFSAVAGGISANYNSLATFLAANPGWATPANVASGVAGQPGLIGLGAGVFAAGDYSIANIGKGASASYFLLGWTGAAASFDAALASGTAFMGMSAIATTATGDTSTTPPGVSVNTKTTFAGMTLSPVVTAVIPEPASFALAGLGLATLLAFRRRS